MDELLHHRTVLEGMASMFLVLHPIVKRGTPLFMDWTMPCQVKGMSEIVDTSKAFRAFRSSVADRPAQPWASDLVDGWLLHMISLCSGMHSQMSSVAANPQQMAIHNRNTEFHICLHELMWMYNDDDPLAVLDTDHLREFWVASFGATTVCVSFEQIWAALEPMMAPAADVNDLERARNNLELILHGDNRPFVTPFQFARAVALHGMPDTPQACRRSLGFFVDNLPNVCQRRGFMWDGSSSAAFEVLRRHLSSSNNAPVWLLSRPSRTMPFSLVISALRSPNGIDKTIVPIRCDRHDSLQAALEIIADSEGISDLSRFAFLKPKDFL